MNRVVTDHLDETEFRIPVAGHEALDAFRHPFAYARPDDVPRDGVSSAGSMR